MTISRQNASPCRERRAALGPAVSSVGSTIEMLRSHDGKTFAPRALVFKTGCADAYGTAKNQPGKLNVPVCIGDVQINPGDIVIGDQDGVVIVRQDEVDDVIRSSEAREEKEAMFRARIRDGATTVELMGLEETLRRFNLD